MLISKIKQGFTLLETSISVSVLIVLVMCALNIQCRVIKVQEFNNKVDNGMNLIQLAANRLVLKYDYDTIKKYISNEPWIINSENLEFNILKQNELLSLLEQNVKDRNMYLKVYIEGDKVISIKTELIRNIQGRAESFKYEVYKGCY